MKVKAENDKHIYVAIVMETYKGISLFLDIWTEWIQEGYGLFVFHFFDLRSVNEAFYKQIVDNHDYILYSVHNNKTTRKFLALCENVDMGCFEHDLMGIRDDSYRHKNTKHFFYADKYHVKNAHPNIKDKIVLCDWWKGDIEGIERKKNHVVVFDEFFGFPIYIKSHDMHRIPTIAICKYLHENGFVPHLKCGVKRYKNIPDYIIQHTCSRGTIEVLRECEFSIGCEGGLNVESLRYGCKPFLICHNDDSVVQRIDEWHTKVHFKVASPDKNHLMKLPLTWLPGVTKKIEGTKSFIERIKEPYLVDKSEYFYDIKKTFVQTLKETLLKE